MFSHLRANLLLLSVSIVLCAVAYPLTLLSLSQVLAKDRAEGSLLRRKDGTVIGSRQIAQEFTKPQYFQPRPSAAGYKANASGGSNLAASNPALRDRVARDVAAITIEGDEKLGQEIESWARQQPQPLLHWVKKNAILASNWLDDNKDAVAAWMKDHTEAGDSFHAAFAKQYPDAWPKIEEVKIGTETSKRVIASKDGADIQAAYFDMYLQAHPTQAANLKHPVPADRVTTSGSGLDPHITRRNADSQVERVVKEWKKLKPSASSGVEEVVRKALERHSTTHLFGSEPLVNVLELNLEIEESLHR